MPFPVPRNPFPMGKGGSPYQPHPGARVHRYRCSLPGLAGFTASRREGTNTSYH